MRYAKSSIRRTPVGDDLTAEGVELLLYGDIVLPRRYENRVPFAGLDEMWAAWREHRARLLEWWIRGIPDAARAGLTDFIRLKHVAQPGARPWAWWRFDAPEPRRRIVAVIEAGGRERAPTADDVAAAWENQCSSWCTDVDFNQFGVPRFWRPYRWESEADYLERHGLMSDTEREALTEVTP